MFKEIRRSERALSDTEMHEIILKAEYGVLSTIGEDGFPYGVPVNYVYHENNIYFHCATEGQKIENIGFNNKVSFVVVTDAEILPSSFSTNYRSVIAFGIASEVTDIDRKRDVFTKLLEKFSKEFLSDGMKYIESGLHKAKVYQIKVEHITAKGRK